MTSIKDKYLTLQVVAEILSCTERHIYDLIVEGSLTAIKVGGRAVRVSEQSLIEFIEKRKVNPEDLFDPARDDEKKQPPPEQKQPARSKFISR